MSCCIISLKIRQAAIDKLRLRNETLAGVQSVKQYDRFLLHDGVHTHTKQYQFPAVMVVMFTYIFLSQIFLCSTVRMEAELALT